MNEEERQSLKLMVLKLGRKPEYTWMFWFAGWVKGRWNGNLPWAEWVEESLEAFAQEVREHLSPGKGILDWEDLDALGLEFRNAWEKRALGYETGRLEEAMKSASEDPLGLSGNLNRWVAKIVNLGYCLQEQQREIPFLIPVCEDVAKSLDTSLRTLSLALNEAIAQDYIRVEKEAVFNSRQRTARRLRFNYERLDQT